MLSFYATCGIEKYIEFLCYSQYCLFPYTSHKYIPNELLRSLTDVEFYATCSIEKDIEFLCYSQYCLSPLHKSQ